MKHRPFHSDHCRFWGTLLLILALFSAPLFAKEGFGKGKGIPAKVLKAQDSVFMVYASKSESSGEITTTKNDHGTAFVVGEDETHFYFATAEHVIEDLCEKLCPGIVLHQKATVLTYAFTDVIPSFEKGSVSFDKIELVDRYKNPDIALLRAEKIKDVKYSLKPLKFSKASPKKLDKLFLIGFPDLSLRNCHNEIEREFKRSGRYLISHKAKRWSQGLFIDLFTSDDNNDANTEVWMGMTVDALKGNSGGPILNEAGEVVGVLVQTVKGKCYLGSENPKNLKPFSFGAPWHWAVEQ